MDDAEWAELVGFLERRRKALGLSAEVVSQRASCARTAVRAWERGRYTPSVRHFVDWLGALGLSVEVVDSEAGSGA